MKRNILPTRKRLALRRLVRGLIVLLVANCVLHTGLLLPIQAIRGTEQRQGVTGTKVVARRWARELYATQLLYLTENEAATVLSDTHWTLLGWESGFGLALDCTTGEPFYAGERSMSRDLGEETLWWYFGRVDDPEIDSVAISVQETRYEDGQPGAQTESYLVIPESQWLERDGRRYFLISTAVERGSGSSSVHRRAEAVALDSGGREVARFEIRDGSYSSYG